MLLLPSLLCLIIALAWINHMFAMGSTAGTQQIKRQLQRLISTDTVHSGTSFRIMIFQQIIQNWHANGQNSGAIRITILTSDVV
jgi:hypothetical protein